MSIFIIFASRNCHVRQFIHPGCVFLLNMNISDICACLWFCGPGSLSKVCCRPGDTIKNIFVPTLSAEWPLSATLTAAPVFFCFSFFLSLPLSFSFLSIKTLKDFLHYSPPPSTPLSASLSLPPSSAFLLFAPCFDSGCASLGGEDGVPQTLEGYWSRRNTGLCFSMRRHCERGLIVRVRPQRERTKGHSGSLWRPNMKGAPTFNED